MREISGSNTLIILLSFEQNSHTQLRLRDVALVTSAEPGGGGKTQVAVGCCSSGDVKTFILAYLPLPPLTYNQWQEEIT